MWALEALKSEYSTSLITSNEIDLSALNSFYGTSVYEDEVTVRRLPVPQILSKGRAGAVVRGAFIQNAVQRISREFDAIFSSYNMCDFGVPAIHLLDLAWDEGLRAKFAPSPAGFQGLFHRIAHLRGAYLWLGQRLTVRSGRDLFSGEDLMLANSHWVASLIERKHGIKCRLLYPPVPGEFDETPFESRRDDFVCLGRISEEKRLERLFGIIGKVRARGHLVRLRVIGGLDANQYARKIQQLAAELPWVVLEGSVSDERKKEIMRSSRYAIHGAEGEAFGIAVGELLKAGCLTFASACGGPAEILDHEALLYQSDDEAATKISTVLENGRLREHLRNHLRRQAEKFSIRNFNTALHEIVEDFLQSRNPAEMARSAS